MTDAAIDTAVFDELRDSMGADFAVELVTTFLQEAPGMLADLGTAEAGCDADGFRRAAHSLKTNANIFGATTLAELAKGLELGGPKPDGIATLQAEYSRVETALRELTDG